MKVFWVLVGLLMMGAAAYLFWKSDRGGLAPGRGADVPAPVTIATANPEPPRPAPPPASEQPRPTAAPPKPASPPPATSVAEPHGSAPDPSTASPKPAADAQPKPVGPLKPPDDEPSGTDTSKPAAPSPAPASTGAPAAPKAPESPAAPSGPAESAGPKLRVREDGSLIVDDRYVLRGKGTAAEPYKVTWDQLLSAQDDYVPKEGRKKLPGRITMLDGKYVELTGYIAFPVMAETQDECLSMMNQWDGCCIGVPPTPYDAVEVRLRDPASGSARLTTYGSIKGKLKVDPHLVGGWLVGLYVMDGADMKPQSYGGFAP